MPRGNPEPWFRASRNTWYVTINGRQQNLHTADEGEAYRRWHSLMVQAQQAPLAPQAKVAEVLALFADYSERHHKPATYQWHRHFLQTFLDWIPAELGVDQLKPFHVTGWLDHNTQWGVSGRRGAITALKRAFQWATDQGYLPHSPVRMIRKPQGKRRETLLTAEQRQLVLAEAADQAFRDFLILLQETGARPGEVRTVEARHFDEAKGVWIFPPSEHKTGARTGQSRVVYLTPAAIEVCRRLACEHPIGPLCRNARGEPWTRSAIRCRFRRLRRRLADKFPGGLCAYLFRHAYATDALERGVDPITVAELLGHKDTSMVGKIYQHLNQRTEHMRQAARRVRPESASEPKTPEQA